VKCGIWVDTSVAVRFLNGDTAIIERVLTLPEVILPLVVAGELLFGAENSSRPLQNLPRYLEFISTCTVTVVPLGRETTSIYAHNSLTIVIVTQVASYLVEAGNG
jgi:tRNA(fMet)-specific endonuclease VapC